MTYELHALAVLRGVCQAGDPGKFFGSLLALDYWITQAVESGLVLRSVEGLRPTEAGLQIFEHVLSKLPECRQVFWSSPELSSILGKT